MVNYAPLIPSEFSRNETHTKCQRNRAIFREGAWTVSTAGWLASGLHNHLPLSPHRAKQLITREREKGIVCADMIRKAKARLREFQSLARPDRGGGMFTPSPFVSHLYHTAQPKPKAKSHPIQSVSTRRFYGVYGIKCHRRAAADIAG